MVLFCIGPVYILELPVDRTGLLDIDLTVLLEDLGPQDLMAVRTKTLGVFDRLHLLTRKLKVQSLELPNTSAFLTDFCILIWVWVFLRDRHIY